MLRIRRLWFNDLAQKRDRFVEHVPSSQNKLVASILAALSLSEAADASRKNLATFCECIVKSTELSEGFQIF